jgi:hypothetical protein
MKLPDLLHSDDAQIRRLFALAPIGRSILEQTWLKPGGEVLRYDST